MKKPLALIFGFTFIVLFLTGCTSEKTRTTILSKLSSSGIIEDDWEYIDSDVTSAAPIPGISSYEYYYQDESGNIYEISISGSQTETDRNEKYYPVYLSDHMEAKEKTETYTDPETKVSKEILETDYYQTEETATVSYRIYKHKFLFWSFWELQKEEG